jgi:hypothetical protein
LPHIGSASFNLSRKVPCGRPGEARLTEDITALAEEFGRYALPRPGDCAAICREGASHEQRTAEQQPPPLANALHGLPVNGYVNHKRPSRGLQGGHYRAVVERIWLLISTQK